MGLIKEDDKVEVLIFKRISTVKCCQCNSSNVVLECHIEKDVEPKKLHYFVECDECNLRDGITVELK